MFGEDVVPSKDIQPTTRGIIRVKFLSASGLQAADVCGKADPMVVAFVRKLRKYKTQVQPGTLDPVWNEETFFLVKEISQNIHVEVLDADTSVGSILTGGKNVYELMGRAK